MTAPLLEVDGLSIEFDTADGPVRPVRDVSYALRAGESVAILGESGSGKTVASRAIMGLLAPTGRVTSGSVRLEGRDVPLQRDARRVSSVAGREIAMVFQDALAALNPVFTVGWQIAEVFRVHQKLGRRAARGRAIEAMQRVGIPDAPRRFDAYPHEFSGGMRQRVMIAIAVALNPKVLIADEPTTALDVTVQAQIMELLQDLRRETGLALVLITHDLGVVADVADRLIVMYAGRVVETGPVKEVYRRPAHPYTRGLIESSPRLDDDAERLVQIPGAPPAPSAVPPGCSFHPRCGFARDRCLVDRPPLELVLPDRRGACHFASEVLDA